MKASGVEASAVNAAEKLVSTVQSAAAAVSAQTEVETESIPTTQRTHGFAERYNEAVKMVNAGDLEAAAAELQTLIAEDLTDREVLAATELYTSVRSFATFRKRADEAMRLTNLGEIEAAIAILEPLLAQAPDQAQTTEVQRMLDKLYGYRDFQANYNRAVELFNDGQYDQAAILLGPLAEGAPTSQLKAMASTLLREIERID